MPTSPRTVNLSNEQRPSVEIPSTPESRARSALVIVKDDIQRISRVWVTWVYLFRNPDEDESTSRYRLMKSPVFIESFFAMLEEVLIRYVTIGITRVLDKKSGVIGVKTLEELVELLDDSKRTPALELAKTARRIHKPAALVRHNVFAHRNEEFATGVRDIGELTIRLDDVYKTIRVMIEFIDIFNEKLNGKQSEMVMLDEDPVGGLFLILDEAEQYRAEHPLFPTRN